MKRPNRAGFGNGTFGSWLIKKKRLLALIAE